MSKEFPFCTYFLTRACDLNCQYCRIRDNKFPNELKISDKLEAIDKIWEVCDFIGLFGGEPLLIDLETVVNHCYKNDIDYAVSSNSVSLTPNRAKKLVDAGLQNWSVSYDGSTLNKGHIREKSNKGLSDLLMFKKMGVPDLQVTITVTKRNIHAVPTITRMLVTQGIWVEITPLHWKMGRHYHFGSPKEAMQDLTFDESDIPMIKRVMQKCKQIKEEYGYVHNEPHYFDIFDEWVVDMNWRCNSISNLTVDADGSLRTCLHYNRGNGKYDIFNLKENMESFITQEMEEIKHCNGCFWDCRWQCQEILERRAKDPHYVFAHDL